MPGWISLWQNIWCNHVHILQQLIISIYQIAPACYKLIQSIHLAIAQGCLHFCHAIVISQINLLVIPRSIRFMCHQGSITSNTMTSIKAQLLIQFLIIGEHHTTFSSGNNLHRMKAEYCHIRVSTASHLGVQIVCSNSMRCIL